MNRINAGVMLLLCTALAVGLVSLGVAGEQRQTPVKQYEGQVKSIKIDKCGLQPGTCEGSIVLAQKGELMWPWSSGQEHGSSAAIIWC